MNRLYNNNIFTQANLNTEIAKILSDKDVEYTTIESKEKRKGNLKRYAPGTVVEIKGEEGITYFFTALSQFDKELHPVTEDDDYVYTLIRLLIYNNKRSQGRPLYLPLIGAGAADTKKEERDILEYIVKLIQLNKKLINCDVHIIVNSSLKNKIAITDL